MRAWIIVIVLALTFQLAAEMDFTQMNTISIPNGTYSHAELKSVQGTDRVVVYSQDMDSIYLTICDTDGNVVETMSLAMTDNTDTSRMSFFEYEETPYIIVNSVEEGDTIYDNENEANWTRDDEIYCRIYSLDSGECIEENILWSVHSYYTEHGEGFSTEDYSIDLRQPKNNRDNDGAYHVYMPVFTYNEGIFSCTPHYTNFVDTIKTRLFECIIDGENIQVNHFIDSGENILTGSIAGYPIITAGRESSKYWPSYDSSRHKYIYTDVCIMEATGYIAFYQSLFCDRYLLLSDHFTDEPETFTMLSFDFNSSEGVFEMFISERDMDGNAVWLTDETTFTEYDLYEGVCVSCCFKDSLNVPLTIYFAPESNKYEIRNRTSGVVTDCGEAPFISTNIERLANETLIFLEADSSSVQVFHANNPIGIDDPTDSPALDLSACNYPNPFNPTTTISFTLPAGGMVEISVYNTRGQLVRTLVNDRLDAGDHQVVWNGDNENGATLSSGVYLYRVSVNGKTTTGKMLMLK